MEFCTFVVVLPLSAHVFHIHHACILLHFCYIKISFELISTLYPDFGVCTKDGKSRGGDEDEDMKRWLGRTGRVICLVQRSSVAQR